MSKIKPRQFKKNCKSAMEILIALQIYKRSDFEMIELRNGIVCQGIDAEVSYYSAIALLYEEYHEYGYSIKPQKSDAQLISMYRKRMKQHVRNNRITGVKYE